MTNEYLLRPGETQDTYLYRLGYMKEMGTVQETWSQLTDILNRVLRTHLPPWDESSWRKRYKRLKLAPPPLVDEGYDEDSDDPAFGDPADALYETRVKTILERDENTSANRLIRTAARSQSLQDIMRETIERFTPPDAALWAPQQTGDQALYAMLSDIHYGISYSNRSGVYNPDIAWSRVMTYADRLCKLGFENNVSTIYVSLMGDMISGIIHQTIRLENREDLVHQIVGASELTAAFLHKLSQSFNSVYVNAVPGNHSRVDPSFSDAARGEKLDSLITWYCKTKLEQIPNVVFVENTLDPTIGVFSIFGKTYVSVHGDLDQDLRVSSVRIQRLLERPVDYMLAGHLHVADMRFEHTGFIRNGSVCGTGDEYTAKKRLYGPAVQVCMLCSVNGVEAVYPIALEEPHESDQ